MKIYSNIITEHDVRQAFNDARNVDGADIYTDALRMWKPRGYAYGVEVWAASDHGKRRSAHYDGYEYPRAATWTDYGYVIARLYNVDPHARIGIYDSKADFVAIVQRYVPRGQTLAFLDVLTDVPFVEYVASA